MKLRAAFLLLVGVGFVGILVLAGFGILRFARPNNTVTFESWPIYDAETPIEKHQQPPGWPKTVTLPE